MRREYKNCHAPTGIKRAAFSNEAGAGSAAIAHSAVNLIYLSQFVREVTFHVAAYSCQANLPVNRIFCEHCLLWINI